MSTKGFDLPSAAAKSRRDGGRVTAPQVFARLQMPAPRRTVHEMDRELHDGSRAVCPPTSIIFRRGLSCYSLKMAEFWPWLLA
jgi:hypothetical protein